MTNRQGLQSMMEAQRSWGRLVSHICAGDMLDLLGRVEAAILAGSLARACRSRKLMLRNCQ